MAAKFTVTEFLTRARECAAVADKLDGDDKVHLLRIADDWLKLADEVAKGTLHIESELSRKQWPQHKPNDE